MDGRQSTYEARDTWRRNATPAGPPRRRGILFFCLTGTLHPSSPLPLFLASLCWALIKLLTIMSDAPAPPAPGDEVVVIGLRGNPEFNGQRAVVKPLADWPDNGRVPVLLVHQQGQVSIQLAVKPANLKAVEPACIICLESQGGEQRDKLLALGCGCRGSSGFVHERCAVQAAAAQQERAGTWSGPVGKHPWQLCPTCRLPYTGALKLALAQEWCRRTEALNARDTQRFAARTTLGNALSAAGKLAEAEVVVRGNLETVTELHGSEHRMALGTTLNLGLIIDGLGRHAEAAQIYSGVSIANGEAPIQHLVSATPL